MVTILTLAGVVLVVLPTHLHLYLRATDNRYNPYNQNKLRHRLTDVDLLIVPIVPICLPLDPDN